MSHVNIECHYEDIFEQKVLIRHLMARLIIDDGPEKVIEDLQSASNHLGHCLTHLGWVREFYQKQEDDAKSQ